MGNLPHKGKTEKEEIGGKEMKDGCNAISYLITWLAKHLQEHIPATLLTNHLELRTGKSYTGEGSAYV